MATKAQAKTPNFTHGYSGYTNYRCRCVVCTEANRLRQREARAFWRKSREDIRATGHEQVVRNISHGISGYTNYSCRCTTCVTANRSRER